MSMPFIKCIKYYVACIKLINSKNTKYEILNTKYQKAGGFTLIELLTVVSIIVIFLASVSVSWITAQKKGNDGRRKSDIKAVQQALEIYFQTNGQYPNTSDGQILCNVGSVSEITTPKLWGTDAFTCNNITYLDLLPKDPKNQSVNGYYYSSSGIPRTAYIISAKLENTNDPEISTGSSPSCTNPQSGRNYCVISPK